MTKETVTRQEMAEALRKESDRTDLGRGLLRTRLRVEATRKKIIGRGRERRLAGQQSSARGLVGDSELSSDFSKGTTLYGTLD